MSSRSADRSSSRLRWHSVLGGDSITAHLARLYTLSAVALLAIIVGGLQWLERQSLRADNLLFLNDKVEQIRLILRQFPEDPTFINQEVKVEAGVFTAGLHYILYSRILDHGGRVLVETPGVEAILPPELFPQPTEDSDAPRNSELRRAANGRSYLLASAWDEPGGDPAVRRVIQVALDTADANNVMTLYQRGSVLIVIVGILLSAYSGMLVARSGMRPLVDITRVVNQVNADQLHHRLLPERWPLELVALAQAFNSMLARLDDSHVRLARFSADLAHELRTPINALMGQTEIALGNEQSPEEYRQILASNLEELQRLARMSNEMLFLARAEDPKTRIERRWLDARQLLDDVREFHEALADDRGVAMTCQGHAEIFADAHLVRRAVTNLLSNALRYTPSGGQVALAVEARGATSVALKVSDSGCGIQCEDLPRIFERFFRAVPENVQETDGCGLGLSIVKSITDLHGGSVVVDSVPGRGTVVVLEFPLPRTGSA